MKITFLTSLHAATSGHSLLVLLMIVGMAGMACSNVDLKAVPQALTTVKLEIQNYCPAAGFNYVDHFVYNSSAYFDTDHWATDTDTDGLPDFAEQSAVNFATFGTSYLSPDTSGNGYGDLTKVKLGLNAGEQSVMPICANPGIDTDHDGLSDCDENMIGTDATLADFDLDGIPDGLEVRFGTNPMDPNDALTSITGDGFSNLSKIKMGVTADTYLSPDSQGLMSVYAATPSPTQPNCFTFDISNINIVPVKNGNMLQAIVLEDSQNPPIGGTQSVLRVARTLTVLVPTGIARGSTIIVPDGIHGQYVDGVNIPLIVVGGGS